MTFTMKMMQLMEILFIMILISLFFNSNECTPVPSPNSIQDFDCPISQTEQSYTNDVQEPCDILSVKILFKILFAQ